MNDSLLIPVTLITGFLGSGKTTLLNQLLRQPALADSAVIVNELGEIGIDHLLVSAPAENMVLLDTGCLCCTIRGDLVGTLTDLQRKRASGEVPAFGHLLIETTGLADPVPVMQTVVGDETLGRQYQLHDVVTVVDALHGEGQLAEHPEALKQAAVADALIISKTDLAAPRAVAALRARLARLNPAAELHEVVRGAIDPAVLLRGNVYDPAARAPEVERWLNAHAVRPELVEGRTPHAHYADHIHAYALYHERPIRRAGLVMWLDMLAGLHGANLLRMKGLLNVEGNPVVVHAVQSVVHEPVALDAWPTDDRRSRLVFIVRDMTREEIERTFEAFDYAPASAKPTVDPVAYARFLESMKGFVGRA